MDLFVDLFALVIVATVVSEIGFARAFDGDKGAGPKNFVFGVGAQVVNLLGIGFAHVSVQLYETIYQAAGAFGIEFADDFLQIAVCDVDVAGAESLGEDFGPEGCGDFGSGAVPNEDERDSAGRNVPGIGE